MTKEDTIKLAREVGMEFRENADEFNTAYCDGVHRDELERFAALVAAAEREAIIQTIPGGTSVDPQWVCDMIRARGIM